MNEEIWSKVHGGATHFPIVLLLFAMILDAASFFLPSKERDLRAAARFSVIAGAISVFPAVISGIFLTKGHLFGTGPLLFHHLFVWPSYALLVGLGVWRGLVGAHPSSRAFLVYWVVTLIASLCILAAGYWGGELVFAS